MDPTTQYLTVAGLAAITWFGVPGAGDAALVAAAIAAAGSDSVDIRAVLGAAFIGALIGGGIGYWVGLSGGRAVVLRPGPFLNWRENLVAKADNLFARFGRPASLVALPILCGTNQVPASTYLPFSTIGRLGWVLLTGGLAYVLGPDVVNFLKSFGVPAIATVLGIALVVFGIYYVWSLRHPAAAAEYKRKLEALRASPGGRDGEGERPEE